MKRVLLFTIFTLICLSIVGCKGSEKRIQEYIEEEDYQEANELVNRMIENNKDLDEVSEYLESAYQEAFEAYQDGEEVKAFYGIGNIVFDLGSGELIYDASKDSLLYFVFIQWVNDVIEENRNMEISDCDNGMWRRDTWFECIRPFLEKSDFDYENITLDTEDMSIIYKDDYIEIIVSYEMFEDYYLINNIEYIYSIMDNEYIHIDEVEGFPSGIRLYFGVVKVDDFIGGIGSVITTEDVVLYEETSIVYEYDIHGGGGSRNWTDIDESSIGTIRHLRHYDHDSSSAFYIESDDLVDIDVGYLVDGIAYQYIDYLWDTSSIPENYLLENISSDYSSND